jgi:hypothetical protein
VLTLEQVILWQILGGVAIVSGVFSIVSICRKKFKGITSMEIIIFIYAVGLLLAYFSYSDLKGFLDDMRSELIGMCIEIGLVYIIIEKSLSNDRKRQERKNEAENYYLYLRESFEPLLSEVEYKFLSLFDTEKNELSIDFLKEINNKQIKWDLFEIEQKDLHSRLFFSQIDNIFHPIRKELKDFVVSNKDLMSKGFYESILTLIEALRDLSFPKEFPHATFKESTVIRLMAVGFRIKMIKKQADELTKEVEGEVEAQVSKLNKRFEKNRKRAYRRLMMKWRIQRAKQFFANLWGKAKNKNKNKDKDSDTSASV